MKKSTHNRRGCLTKPREYPNTRSHRKHTSINDLPAEILSLIFTENFPGDPDLESDEVYDNNWSYYSLEASNCLRQAVILSSVSSYFRYAAFGTPELWKRLHLKMDRPIDALVSLLQHCTSHAFSLRISIKSDLDRSDATMLLNAKILLSSETSQKLEYLDLYSSKAPDLWMPLLASFPKLKTLIIGTGWSRRDENLRFDLGALSSLTRICIEGRAMDAVILPPSVRVLNLENVPEGVQASLLPQCPNLVACTNLIEEDYVYGGYSEISYPRPVHLDHLKRMTWLIESGFASTASVRNIRMPVLEHLTLYSYDAIPAMPAAVISICSQVSTTLTVFKLNVIETDDAWQYDDFYHLLRLPLHNLTTLGIQTSEYALEAVIRALIPGSDGCNTSDDNYLPNLKYLNVESLSVFSRERREYVDILPPLLLELLKKWRVGEGSYLSFKLNTGASSKVISSLSSKLQRGLRSIKGERRIDFRLLKYEGGAFLMRIKGGN